MLGLQCYTKNKSKRAVGRLMPMTPVMYILLTGMVLGLVLTAICAIAKKFTGVKICSVICFAFTISFGVYSLTELDKGGYEPVVSEEVAGTATFEEIYKAYKENELVADDLYKGNRYKVTAEINGMTTDGLANLTGGAMLTLEKKVGKTTVFFYAEFEKEQEENLKTVKVGDTITFIGECGSAGYWSDCELVME